MHNQCSCLEGWSDICMIHQPMFCMQVATVKVTANRLLLPKQLAYYLHHTEVTLTFSRSVLSETDRALLAIYAENLHWVVCSLSIGMVSVQSDGYSPPSRLENAKDGQIELSPPRVLWSTHGMVRAERPALVSQSCGVPLSHGEIFTLAFARQSLGSQP